MYDDKLVLDKNPNEAPLGVLYVAIYARVSTQEQAEEGYSIDAQIATIIAQCEREGKRVVKIYADRGVSGKSAANRPELQQLLEDSKLGLFSEVIVWKTSRMSRSVKDLLEIVQALELQSVTFKSLTEPYDTSTPSGRLMMSLLGSIGEFERTTIIENVKLGQKARVKSGLSCGNTRLLGYRGVENKKDVPLVVVPDEALIVSKIFRMYVSEGKGYKAIANALNRDGYRTIRGNLFGIVSIKEIIANKFYCGYVSWGQHPNWNTTRRRNKDPNHLSVKGKHESIISEDDWNLAQQIRATRSDKYPRSYSGEFPLTGLIRCPQCGYGMVAARTVNTLKDGTKKSIRYYSCGQFRNKGSSACSANSVRADEAEKYVFSRIKEVLNNENVLKKLVATLNERRTAVINPLEEESQALKDQLSKCSKRKDRYFDLYADGTFSKDDLTEKIVDIDKTVEELNKREVEIAKEIKLNSAEDIPYEIIKKVMENFNFLILNADKQKRKFFLQLIIDKITVGDDHKIDSINIQFNESIINLMSSYTGGKPNGLPPSFVFKLVI
jgi:Site-specific recombinases, DNA invertase Pin homologs